MPRVHRSIVADLCYHLINRGNDRRTVFHKDADYAAFVGLIDEAQARLPIRLLGYCLMPNHFHLLVWPQDATGISRWMQWLTTTYVSRYHRHHGTSGHLWQGAFKSFPVQDDGHLMTALRYVEANAARAGLVGRARDWSWSSLAARATPAAAARLAAGPLPLPADWADIVDTPVAPDSLEQIRRSVNRGAPFGGADWAGRMALRLGLASTLRARGRPPLAATSTQAPALSR